MSTAGLVEDFDFHPDEPDVRTFCVPRSDVLRLDEDAYVSECAYGDIVLRHYAFNDEWFKINLTIDRAGQIVETASESGAESYAFNCDLATPMMVDGSAVYAVDVFLDVLVSADRTRAKVIDRDELEDALTKDLVTRAEYDGALRGLERLMGLIRSGDLLPFLDAAYPLGPSRAAEALPTRRTPLADLWRAHPSFAANGRGARGRTG